MVGGDAGAGGHSRVGERHLGDDRDDLVMFDAANGGASGDLQQAIAEDAGMMVDKLAEMGVVVREGEVLRGTPLGTWLAVRAGGGRFPGSPTPVAANRRRDSA